MEDKNQIVKHRPLQDRPLWKLDSFIFGNESFIRKEPKRPIQESFDSGRWRDLILFGARLRIALRRSNKRQINDLLSSGDEFSGDEMNKILLTLSGGSLNCRLRREPPIERESRALEIWMGESRS